jgi:hypothetical protein
MLKPFVFAVSIGAVGFLAAIAPSHALTMAECSTKYKAAQAAGNKLKWNDFRKAECGADAAALPTAPAVTPAAAPAKPPAATKPAETKPAVTAKPSPTAAPIAPTPVGNAVFPSAVAPKYSKESEGKARMHTCLDQYNANKVANANGGLKWIEKGGGYYSECNKRLKG